MADYAGLAWYDDQSGRGDVMNQPHDLPCNEIPDQFSDNEFDSAIGSVASFAIKYVKRGGSVDAAKGSSL